MKTIDIDGKIMINTIYGLIEPELVEKFKRIAGHEYIDEYNDWKLLSDEIEYWQLVNSGSSVEEKKWGKKIGWLPVRDLNFQYALLKTVTETKDASGKKVIVYDIPAAIRYAEQRLFLNGKPVYLPEKLSEGLFEDGQKPKSYNKILTEEKAACGINN